MLWHDEVLCRWSLLALLYMCGPFHNCSSYDSTNARGPEAFCQNLHYCEVNMGLQDNAESLAYRNPIQCATLISRRKCEEATLNKETNRGLLTND